MRFDKHYAKEESVLIFCSIFSHEIAVVSGLNDCNVVCQLLFIEMFFMIILNVQAISKESVKYRDLVKKISNEAELILLELSDVDQELLTEKIKRIDNQFEQ